MELWLILKVLLRRWYLILIPVVITAIWVAPDVLRDGPTGDGGFTTTFRYTAGQERDAFAPVDGDLQDVWEASYKLIDAFTEWSRTSSFREEVGIVLAENGLEINTGALGIATDNERAVGLITLSWPNADELAAVADATIITLQTRHQEYFGPQLGGEPAQVIILDEPVVVPAPPPLTDRFGSLVRVALGLVAGVALAFLAEYIDPTLRERDDLRSLGLSVIGTIPKD